MRGPLLVACAVLVAIGARAQPVAAVRAARLVAADSLLEFRLHDQFGQLHDAAAYRGRTLILVGAGRGGRDAGTAWVEHLRAVQDSGGGADTLQAVPVVAVADLRGVPRLLRRLVRGRFPDDRRRAVLLDWDGALARRFGFDTERCTLLVVGPSGRAHARTTTMAVDTTLARTLLREAAQLTTATAAGGSGAGR